MKKPPHGLARGLTNYGDAGFSLYLRRSFAKSMGYSTEMLGRKVEPSLEPPRPPPAAPRDPPVPAAAPPVPPPPVGLVRGSPLAHAPRTKKRNASGRTGPIEVRGKQRRRICIRALAVALHRERRIDVARVLP